MCKRLGREWGVPLLWLLWSRGGCLERGILAYMLGVKAATVKRMVWGLSRVGLVEASGARVCLTPKGAGLVEHAALAARHGRKHVIALQGLLIYVVHRDRGASARLIPCRLACSVYKVVLAGMEKPAAIANATGVASKTASYVYKALRVLGCPGAGCVLREACGCGTEGKE